ncbi:MAG: O-antigen ligase family protein [Leptolyngbyaceae cyanobacterium SL_7_1]|nr:O-antigen ligase family protein [Leptolyngbyaceae cyanobacterium SL_7_1]
MQLPLYTIERGLAIVALLFHAGAFSAAPAIVESLLRYGIWMLILAFLGMRWKQSIYTLSRDLALLTLLILIVASWIWSTSPGLTLYFIREISQWTMLALYIASRFSPRQQVGLLSWMMGIGAVLSVGVSLAVPSIGVHFGDGHDGAWMGVFSHKNFFGSVMVVSYQVFLLRMLYERSQRWLYRLGCALSLGLILASTSKTALMIAVLLTLFIFFYRNFRAQGRVTVLLLILFSLLLGCVAIVVASNWNELLLSLGRDPTLTGRVPIWNYTIDKIAERPFIGYGYGAFWAKDSRYALEAGRAVAGWTTLDLWIPPHAHNGFIDMALSVGLLGLICF